MNFAEQLASKLAGMKQEPSPTGTLMDSIEAESGPDDARKRKITHRLNPEVAAVTKTPRLTVVPTPNNG